MRSSRRTDRLHVLGGYHLDKLIPFAIHLFECPFDHGTIHFHVRFSLVIDESHHTVGGRYQHESLQQLRPEAD
jgi:hypothetical protein